MYLILFALLVASCIYLFLLKPNKFWRNKCVRYEQPMILFGNMFSMVMQRENFGECITRIYNKHKKNRYVGIFQFTQPILLVRDLDLIKQIAIKEADTFVDHQTFSREDIDPLWSKNLFAAKGERWHEMRTALSPSFTSSKMKMMFGLINDCADEYVRYFVEKAGDGAGGQVQEVELKNLFSRFTNDTIATCAFGVTANSLRDPTNDFYMKGLEASNLSGIRALKFFFYPFCPSLFKFFKIKIIVDEVGEFFRGIISETLSIRAAQGIVRPDMIQLMMETRKKMGVARLTDEDITAQALIFFLAGFETASILMCFAGYELAVNPDVQQRLKREIDDTLAAHGGQLTYDALMSMKYLDMVINETLRKWPPTPMTDRVVAKEHYVLTPKYADEVGVTLRKNDICWIPIFPLHRDPKHFPNPERFDPERFNDDNKHRAQQAFLPFGLGPRNCIGSRFVLMENKAILVKFLLEFEFVRVAKTSEPMVLHKAQFSSYAAGGWWIGLKKRASS